MSNNINILVEAKKEYTLQLQKILKPRIYEGFKSIYEDIIDVSAKELEENKIQNSSLIKSFQKILKEVPQWNIDNIKNESERIIKISNCDYFDSLIEAVFITNTKILTSVQINETKPINIKINIPQPQHFIHKCYMKCANEFYKNPYVFDNSKNISPKEKHNNLREALSLIDVGINNAISDLLPIGDILKKGLTKNNYEEQDDADEDAEEDDDEDEDAEDADEKKEENIIINDNEKDDNVQLNNNENYIDIGKSDFNKEDDEINETLTHVSEATEKEASKVINLNNDNDDIKIIIPKIDEQKNDYIDNLNELPQKVESAPEIKKIVYSKVIPPFANLIKNNNNINNDIVKNNNNDVINLTNVEPIYEHKKIVQPHFMNILDNESIKNTDETPLIQKTEKNNLQNNHFIKNIKNMKFKNKLLGGGNNKSNMSFYKKKYEENSANYNYISDNLKDNIITTIDDLKNTQQSVKIIKNKINIDDASSDEDEPSLLNLE